MTRWFLIGFLSVGTLQLTGCSTESSTSKGSTGGSSGSAGAGGAAGNAGVGGSANGGVAGSGVAGTAGVGGTTGGTGGSAGGSGGAAGSAGALTATGKCGDAVPCAAGAYCEHWEAEAGQFCECDSSGHFLCDSWSTGGVPPFPPCNKDEVSGSETCSHSNGFCTRSCSTAGCDETCDGNGPEDPNAGEVCDLNYCADVDSTGHGGCALKTGESCDYRVTCQGHEVYLLEGSCESL